jgi:hypothetical protein
VFLTFWAGEPWRRGLRRGAVLLVSALLAFRAFSGYLDPRMRDNGGLAVTLWTTLAEYPGTHRGWRLWQDHFTAPYCRERATLYEQTGDRLFRLITFPDRHLTGERYDPELAVYIREMVFGHPVLFADRVIRRFVAYLPAHPAHTYVFLDFLLAHEAVPTRPATSFHPAYPGLKYIDWALFALFAAGVWNARRNTRLRSLLCIYLGVLIGHVFVGVGDIYWRGPTFYAGPVPAGPGVEEEYRYWEPRYLIVMTTLWPVFIPLAGKRQRVGMPRPD